MTTIDRAQVHAQLVVIADRLLAVSEQFEQVGQRLSDLCAQVGRLTDKFYAQETSHGT